MTDAFYLEGFNSFYRGKLISECPYIKDSYENYKWIEGWYRAKYIDGQGDYWRYEFALEYSSR